MKTMSLIAASVFAVGLAFSSGAVAGEGKDSQSMGQDSRSMDSQTMESREGSSAGMTSEGQSQQAGAGSQASSSQVRQVQEGLKEKGYETGAVDGIMGPKTAGALRNFQQDEGIEASGRIDSQTLEALGVSSQEQFGVSPQFGEEQEESGSEGSETQEYMQDQGMQGQEEMKEGSQEETR